MIVLPHFIYPPNGLVHLSHLTNDRNIAASELIVYTCIEYNRLPPLLHHNVRYQPLHTFCNSTRIPYTQTAGEKCTLGTSAYVYDDIDSTSPLIEDLNVSTTRSSLCSERPCHL